MWHLCARGRPSHRIFRARISRERLCFEAGPVCFSFPAHKCATRTDVKDESIDLEDETLKFKGKSESKDYEVDIAFLKPVDSEGSTYKVLPRSVQMHVMKKNKDDEEFWPRLLKDKTLEKNQVKIDWDRYVDEDEEEEGFDTSNVSCNDPTKASKRSMQTSEPTIFEQ